MKYSILALWNIFAGGDRSMESRLNQIQEQEDELAEFYGGIAALADGNRAVAAKLFIEFGERLIGRGQGK